MKILVVNSGSSSIKFQVFDNEISLISGVVEQIGEKNSAIVVKLPQKDEIKKNLPIKTHVDGLETVAKYLIDYDIIENLSEFDGIGHRIVHGGEYFKGPAIVDESVIKKIEKLKPLAPLHNPAHLDGIKVTRELSPNVPNVVVFDTAFHQSIPPYAYMYALPYEYYVEDRVRRYGFHGTSHHFVAKEAAKIMQKDFNSFNAITLHLGNGASVTAIENGQSIDTSMGLTPLEGLVMGTRSGDLDPAIMFYLARKRGFNIDKLDTILNKESGLKGICGVNDMREIYALVEQGNEKAQLALDIFYYRLKKYIGSYHVVLEDIDCLVFTGGIGENDYKTREKSCQGLESLGIKIDKEKNMQRGKEAREISTLDSKVKVFVIPTNEELEIALQTQELVRSLA
jgi:acetate kinase